MIKGKFFKTVATAGVLASLIAAPAFAGDVIKQDITMASSEKYKQFVSTVPQKYPTFFVEGGTSEVFDVAVRAGERISDQEGRKVVVVKVNSTRDQETEACISVSYKGVSLPASCTSVLPEIWNKEENRDDTYIAAVREQYASLEESVVKKASTAILGNTVAAVSSGDTSITYPTVAAIIK